MIYKIHIYITKIISNIFYPTLAMSKSYKQLWGDPPSMEPWLHHGHLRLRDQALGMCMQIPKRSRHVDGRPGLSRPTQRIGRQVQWNNSVNSRWWYGRYGRYGVHIYILRDFSWWLKNVIKQLITCNCGKNNLSMMFVA